MTTQKTMIKNTLYQTMSQKLSPTQIQLMNMLSLPVLSFEQYVNAEIEANPALEASYDSLDDTADEIHEDDKYDDFSSSDKDDDMNEYLYGDDDMGDDYEGGNSSSGGNFIAAHSVKDSFVESLMSQLALESLTDREMMIGRYIIGNIDEDGYLRSDIMSISDDLIFSQGLDVKEEEIEKVLKLIQTFEPSGIAARNLQECLSIQLGLKKMQPSTALSIKIVEKYFEALSRKNYDKILREEGCSREELSAAVEEISSLNPRPGGGGQEDTVGGNMEITPDFIISIDGDTVSVSLYSGGVPSLHISEDYTRMLTDVQSGSTSSREKNDALVFVKSKVDAARWFIDAIEQRRRTMMRTMRAIVKRQKAFILSGDVADMRPMALKDIAADVSMDISTISRVVSQKYAYTPYGTMSLKDFFSDGRTTSTGEDVSVKEIKQSLAYMIESEDKNNPLTDEKLTERLVKEGYPLSRRTVAKYREAMGIPVARMRKKV